MEIKTVLTEQFAATNNQKNWFAPLSVAIENLTAEQASWKPEYGDHSILNLVAHLYYWNRRLLNQMQGIPNKKMQGDNDSTFESATDSWTVLQEKTKNMMRDFESEIRKFDEAKLQSPVSDTNKSTWYSVLSNTNLHNSYHIGQMVMLRKMQQAWDAKKNGVN